MIENSKKNKIQESPRDGTQLSQSNNPPEGWRKDPEGKKEERVKEEKRTFERWVKDKKINHPVYLRIIAGFSESSLLTEKEFDSAVDKYLFNKE